MHDPDHDNVTSADVMVFDQLVGAYCIPIIFPLPELTNYQPHSRKATEDIPDITPLLNLKKCTFSKI